LSFLALSVSSLFLQACGEDERMDWIKQLCLAGATLRSPNTQVLVLRPPTQNERGVALQPRLYKQGLAVNSLIDLSMSKFISTFQFVFEQASWTSAAFTTPTGSVVSFESRKRHPVFPLSSTLRSHRM
jgi:hypothetical protein